MIKRFAITAAVVLLATAAAGPAAAQEPRASLPDVEDEVMCTICGTLLEESQSPQADRERALIRRLIAEGRDKDQIKDALVAEYGPRVLATPSGHGFDLLAWIVPGVVLLAGLIAGILAVRRSLRGRGGGDGDRDAPEPSRADLNELERDMSSYDI
jgi:cytochrome c-type biogenesis protein CcmH/NrfF